jgi:hypothetical protein
MYKRLFGYWPIPSMGGEGILVPSLKISSHVKFVFNLFYLIGLSEIIRGSQVKTLNQSQSNLSSRQLYFKVYP